MKIPNTSNNILFIDIEDIYYKNILESMINIARNVRRQFTSKSNVDIRAVNAGNEWGHPTNSFKLEAFNGKSNVEFLFVIFNKDSIALCCHQNIHRIKYEDFDESEIESIISSSLISSLLYSKWISNE